MIEYAFYAIVAAAALVALWNWRAALYVCILLDIARDPVRKMAPGHPLLITLSINAVWVAIAIGVLAQERRRIAEMTRRYPKLKTAAMLLVVAIVPGAVTATIQFESGWQLALMGAASYLAVVPGILIGYVFPRSIADITRFLAFYCIANSVALIGGVAEYLHWGWAGLGGIDIHWIRTRSGYTVDLINGFYRSPDIMGMHAAGVCLFGLVLILAGTRRGRYAWFLPVTWGTVLMLLAGRRKMIGIPVVFAVSFMYFMFRRTGKVFRVAWYLAASGAAIVLVFAFSDKLGISANYTTYASSLWTREGTERSSAGLLDSVLTTFAQSGVFGRGLGTATQGGRYISGKAAAWQEDGGGKLFVELGLIGVALLACAGWHLIHVCRSALRVLLPDSPALPLQVGLMSVVVGNLASFIISHQAYSGDPTSVCLVLLCMGSALSLPEVAMAGRPASRPRIISETR